MKQSKPDKKAITPYTRERVQEIITRNLRADCDPEIILKNLGETILPNMLDGEKAEKEQATEKYNKLQREIVSLGELDNHYLISESVNKEYRPLLISMGRDLHKEFDVQTASEKGLVEIAVGAFGRYLEYSSRLYNLLNVEFLSHEKNGYYCVIAKEVDRAHRQYVTAISTLKQIKSPGFEVNIHAKTALLGQYQQVISTDKGEEIKQVTHNDAT